MAEQVNREQRPHTGISAGHLLASLPAASIVVLDQLTKAMIVNTFYIGQSKEIIPGLFNLCHARNTGVVFGMFPGNSRLFAALTLAAILILVLLVRSLEESASRWQHIAYGLIIGGAAGIQRSRLRRMCRCGISAVEHDSRIHEEPLRCCLLTSFISVQSTCAGTG